MIPSTIGTASRNCGFIMDYAATLGALGIIKETYALNVFCEFLNDTDPEFRDFFDKVDIESDEVVEK